MENHIFAPGVYIMQNIMSRGWGKKDTAGEKNENWEKMIKKTKKGKEGNEKEG